MKNRTLSLILALAAAISLLTGCQNTAESSYDSYITSYETSAAADVENSVENVETEVSEPVFSEDIPMANPSRKPAAPATVANLNNETFLKYTSLSEKYNSKNANLHNYIYNFNKSLTAGYGENNEYIYTEAYYGAKGVVNNRKVTISLYNHTNTKLTVKDVTLEHMDASDASKSKISFTNNKLTVDTSNYANGLHRVWFKYSNGKYVKINFYVNGKDTWLCQTAQISDKTAKAYAARRSDLAKVLKNGNVTVSNSTSLENVWYPYYAFDSSYRCDTQKWIDLSNKIVDKNWSDEYKLFVIQDWIRNNLAYDKYASSISDSRADYYNDFSGTYSVYETKTGICFDYANVICIMCREQNIPAVTIGSEKTNHVWNAIYINNRWIEYDACSQEKYWTKTSDTTVKVHSSDYKDPYGGIYKIIPWWWQDEMPSDALANQYFQQNSYYVY